MNPIKLVLLLLGALLSAQPAALASPIYELTPLGILPGGYTSSVATGIDNQGEVVGYSSVTNSGPDQAFLWTQSGGMIGLGGNSKALAVSNGNVVGSVDNGQPQAFRWTQATGKVLLDPNNSGQATGISSDLRVVGTRYLINSNFRAVTWGANNVMDSSPISNSNAVGAGINASGRYVGTLLPAATGSPMQATGLVGTAGGSAGGLLFTLLPAAINDLSMVVGTNNLIASYRMLPSGSAISIGTLLGDQSSNATAVNALGSLIVGNSFGHNAFVYDVAAASMHSLTLSLKPEFSGWTIRSATGVNDDGWIVGLGEFNGVKQAVLLTPIPEPSSIILAAFGLASLALYSWRKRSQNA